MYWQSQSNQFPQFVNSRHGPVPQTFTQLVYVFILLRTAHLSLARAKPLKRRARRTKCRLGCESLSWIDTQSTSCRWRDSPSGEWKYEGRAEGPFVTSRVFVVCGQQKLKKVSGFKFALNPVPGKPSNRALHHKQGPNLNTHVRVCHWSAHKVWDWTHSPCFIFSQMVSIHIHKGLRNKNHEPQTKTSALTLFLPWNEINWKRHSFSNFAILIFESWAPGPHRRLSAFQKNQGDYSSLWLRKRQLSWWFCNPIHLYPSDLSRWYCWYSAL